MRNFEAAGYICLFEYDDYIQKRDTIFFNCDHFHHFKDYISVALVFFMNRVPSELMSLLEFEMRERCYNLLEMR